MASLNLLLPQVLVMFLGAIHGRENQASPQAPQLTTVAALVRLDSLGDPLPPRAVARLGTTRLQHTRELISIRFSPDGKSLIAGSYEASRNSLPPEGFRFWDPKTGKLQRKLGGFIYGPGRLALSPDGTLLATASGDRFIGVAELETGRIRYQIDWAGKGNVNTSFSADGKILAVQDNDSDIQLWDASTGAILRRIPSNGGFAISYSPDGKLLATAGKKAIYAWNPVTGKEVWHCDTPSSSILQFSHDGKLLATNGDQNGGVSILDAHTGKLIRQWQAHENGPRALVFSPDAAVLVTGSDGHPGDGKGMGGIRLWEVATGKLIRELAGQEGITLDLDFSPDGAILASCGDDDLVRLWDPQTGKNLYPRPGRQAAVHTVAYSPDGKVLASSGADGAVSFWRWQAGQAVKTYREGNDPVRSIAFSPDGTLLATASSNGMVRLYDPVTGLKQTLGNPGDGENIYAIAFHPNGRFLASSGDDDTRLWDLATAKEVRSLGGGNRQSPVKSAIFSPDGKVLATTKHDGTVQLVEVDTGMPFRTLKAWRHSSTAVAFHPDGKILAVANFDVPIRLIDIYTGEERIRYKPSSYGSDSIAFSPDGWFLVTIDNLTDLVIWEAITTKEVVRLKGHEDFIRAVAFAPDGKTVTSASRDRSLIVWDATGLDTQADAKAGTPSDTELENCWNELASADAQAACQAMWQLRAAPRESAHFLNQRLITAPPVDPNSIARLIGELDDDHFAVRERASKALAKLGASALTELEEALANSKSAEQRSRCQELLQKLEYKLLPAESLRALRAVAVLEFTKVPEAEQVLARLAQSGGDARIRGAAQGAMQRRKKSNVVP